MGCLMECDALRHYRSDQWGDQEKPVLFRLEDLDKTRWVSVCTAPYMNGKKAQDHSLHAGPSNSSASKSNLAWRHDRNIEHGAVGLCDSAATKRRSQREEKTNN